MTDAIVERALEQLEGHADYRILRRFRPRPEYGLLRDPKIALFVDVEATGLNTDEDTIIQFAGVRFEFDAAGNVGQVGPVYSGLEDPGVPLAPEIVELTGLTNDRLRGQHIDDAKVRELLDGVVLVIAHNADYDRKMIERRLPGFDRVAWACSQRDVAWERFGCRGIKLDYLMMLLCGEFYDAHDALQDCLAGVHVLATPRCLPGGKCLCASDSMTGDDGCPVHGEPVSPFQLLLQSVRTPTLRIFAEDSPFHTKDRLRLRRYRWYPDPIRAWAKDIKADQLEAERAWLREHVYAGVCDYSTVRKIPATDRYSCRA